MKKFIAIYLAPQAEMVDIMAKMTKEDGQRVMAEWGAWIDAHQSWIVEIGAPMGKTMRVSGAGVAEGKNDMTGFSIVQAESHEEAAKLFTDHPHLKISPNATVDVMVWIDMPGM